MIRDLVRPRNRIFLSMYVAIFGKEYNEIQKKLYRDSLMAGFRRKEFIDMCAGSDLAHLSIEQRFITHLDIVKKSANLREYHDNPPANKESGFMERFARRRYIVK